MSTVYPFIKNYDGLIARFCLFDDFSKHFVASYQNHLIGSGRIQRIRSTQMTMPELMTIMVEFHYSRYADFKAFYLEYVEKHLVTLFPKLVSYNRFVELMPRILIPLLFCLRTLMGGTCTGISFIDSTILKVFHIKRIFNHKVFARQAKRGKNTMGWFFGFKLHLVINDKGDLLNWCLTPGNVDDRQPLLKLVKNLFGKLFGDKGYISSDWFIKLFFKGINLVTGVRSNMKNKLMPLMDKIYLRKRSLIETINDCLKNVCHIEHSRHRSPTNFLVNLVSGLLAYQLLPKKPKLNLTNSELRLLPAVC